MHAESVLRPTCFVWLYSIVLFRFKGVCVNISAVFIFSALLVCVLDIALAPSVCQNTCYLTRTDCLFLPANTVRGDWCDQ